MREKREVRVADLATAFHAEQHDAGDAPALLLLDEAVA